MHTLRQALGSGSALSIYTVFFKHFLTSLDFLFNDTERVYNDHVYFKVGVYRRTRNRCWFLLRPIFKNGLFNQRSYLEEYRYILFWEITGLVYKHLLMCIYTCGWLSILFDLMYWEWTTADSEVACIRHVCVHMLHDKAVITELSRSRLTQKYYNAWIAVQLYHAQMAAHEMDVV